MPSLYVIQGHDQGTRFDLHEAEISVGRGAGDGIQLHDSEVSRRHARLKLNGANYKIIDAESSNGIFVNGNRVHEYELLSGDQIQLGRTLILYTGNIPAARSQVDDIAIVGEEQSHQESRIIESMVPEPSEQVFAERVDDNSDAWLARARSNLQVMYRTALAVSHTLDLDELMDRIMQLIFEWVEADRGCMMLLESDTRQLVPKVRRDRTSAEPADSMRISGTILDYVVQNNEGVLTSDARQDSRWDSAASIIQTGVREAICVPMRGRYGVVGVIYIDTVIPPETVIRQHGKARKFNQEHLKLMIAIAHQAALAIEDTNYYSALVKSERLAAVGQTIAALSHHIKNILQGVRSASYLVDEGLKNGDDEVARKGWKMVQRNQDRIWSLVMDMLTFSKDRQPEWTLGDVNETVADVLELMRTRAEELGVQLSCSHDAENSPAEFDAESMHRAILNIISNAVDACADKPAGRVDVETKFDSSSNTMRIIVSDNGEGIEEEDFDSLFSPFFSKKGARGTGLGLAVSRKILQEHGGGIEVRSQRGKGSTFTLAWPLREGSPAISLTRVAEDQ